MDGIFSLHYPSFNIILLLFFGAMAMYKHS